MEKNYPNSILQKCADLMVYSSVSQSFIYMEITWGSCGNIFLFSGYEDSAFLTSSEKIRALLICGKSFSIKSYSCNMNINCQQVWLNWTRTCNSETCESPPPPKFLCVLGLLPLTSLCIHVPESILAVFGFCTPFIQQESPVFSQGSPPNLLAQSSFFCCCCLIWGKFQGGVTREIGYHQAFYSSPHLSFYSFSTITSNLFSVALYRTATSGSQLLKI